MIRQINKNELPLCLDFIHLCFSTVAEKFGFTQENAPGHNAFMPLEKLENFWNWGFLMYGLFEENQNGEKELLGYFSLSKDPEKKDTYVLHNLCVKPQMRKQGYGKALLDFAKDKVRELGGKILFLDFIDEYKELKEWYFNNGFEPKGTVKYDHLPFTVGYAECFVGEKKNKLVLPDYKNCIANLANSILKKFNAEPRGDSLPLLDQHLTRDYKNIIVFLLDGMGKVILERHLAEKGPFRSHLAGIYTSTFLSTTVAATTSVMSGLQPCEHSWLGWDCYYPQVDKNVTVFLNVEQGTQNPAADYNLAWTTTPYENVVNRIKNHGGQAYLEAPFINREIDSFENLCDCVRADCAKPGQKYIYAYWNQPDGLLHHYGCGSKEVKENLLALEAQVASLAEELETETDDSLIIVTADHGHIDNRQVWLRDYPQLHECLEREPSLEPRVLNLFVKPEKEDFFVQEFNKTFGDDFDLLPVEEVIKRKLFGTGQPHQNFRSMLGNYLAIAKGNLSIMTVDEQFIGMHGSLTEDEMLIPLILFDKQENHNR